MKTFRFIFFSIVVLFLQSCAINQKDGIQKKGKWVYQSTLSPDLSEIIKGRYDKKGEQKGTWKTKHNNKLVKKERFIKNKVLIYYYHPNGKIERKGQGFFSHIGPQSRFYYQGIWFLYNTKGELIQTNYYKQGKLEQQNIVHNDQVTTK
ncbi:hypothetical protein ACYSNM_07560 [Myroides sp. LJL116]